MEGAAGKKPTAVVKVGGDILLHRTERQGLAENISRLVETGWRVVVLHGGGPQVNRLQALHGLAPRKVGGRRITSPADLTVVKQALCGQVNVDLVSVLLAAGVKAFGCHGASAHLIQALKRPPRRVSGAGDSPVDFGEVGDVTGVNTPLLQGLLNLDLVPVIASLGVGRDGRVYNINADTTVAKVAAALRAELLILTTKIGGIYRDIDSPGSRIQTVTPTEARQLIDAGVIVDGMIPKVEEALALLDAGVGAIAIVNASEPAAFTDIAANRGQFGTRIIRD